MQIPKTAALLCLVFLACSPQAWSQNPLAIAPVYASG
jgi:hypothetical protein